MVLFLPPGVACGTTVKVSLQESGGGLLQKGPISLPPGSSSPKQILAPRTTRDSSFKAEEKTNPFSGQPLGSMHRSTVYREASLHPEPGSMSMLAWRTIRRDWEPGMGFRILSSPGWGSCGEGDWTLSGLSGFACPSNSLARLTTRAASASWATERRCCKGGLRQNGAGPSMRLTALRTRPLAGWYESCLQSWEWPLGALRPRGPGL